MHTALSILLFLLIFQFVSEKKFRSVINWELLIFVCGLSGLAYTANDIGLIRWLEGQTEWISHHMHNHFMWVVVFLALITQVGQFILPRDININMLCVVFIPLFQANGLSPWVAVYIISTIGRMVFFKYQDVEYQEFSKTLYKNAPDVAQKIWRARVLMNIFFVASVYVGIYYWRLIGILPW